MGILLFVLKYIVYFLASEDDNGVFWPAKIMASPFIPRLTKTGDGYHPLGDFLSFPTTKEQVTYAI